jgi:hypothetical protein
VLLHCNLDQEATKYNYTVTSDNDLSANFTGLYLAYSTALTKADYSVVPRVINRYFLGTLGINHALAKAEFDEIRSAWGNLCKTVWGDELAHMYRGIEVALDTQTTMRVVQTTEHVYRGIILYGGCYRLYMRDTIFIPVNKNELLAELVNSNPHTASLKFIYDSIYYPDESGRQSAMKAARTLRDVNLQIIMQGAIPQRLDEIRRKAHMLTFPGSQGEFLSATAHNITSVFGAIADSSISETGFPLHPDAITSQDRTERLLSAFGSEVPTFRVPGGKKMSLDGRFAITERGADGRPESRDLHTIGAILLPLRSAYPAFKTMKDEKAVLNPFGAKLAIQASSTSRIKKWEKESGDAIIVALRGAVGASANATSGKGKKRVAEDNSIDDRGTKRASAFDLDF